MIHLRVLAAGWRYRWWYEATRPCPDVPGAHERVTGHVWAIGIERARLRARHATAVAFDVGTLYAVEETNDS